MPAQRFQSATRITGRSKDKKRMSKLTIGMAIVSIGTIVAGCLTMSPEERRAAYQEEFERLASLPVAQQVSSPNKDVSGCAMLSCGLFNEVQPLMKAYVAKVESSREYTGFMNDIRYYAEEEKLSNADACKKVMDAVLAADAARPDDQKIWPKIKKGIDAANELDPKKQLIQIAALTVKNQEVSKKVETLPESYAQEDFTGKMARGKECSAISKQLADVTECLVFLGDQYARVVELENCSR